METTLKVLNAVLNSDAFVTLIGATAAWVVAVLFTKKPEWKKYEGLMISAIKVSEKASEGASFTGAQKLKVALGAFTDQYTDHYGQPPTDKVLAAVRAGIPIVHDQLDGNGTL